MPVHHIRDDKVVQSVHADFTHDGPTTITVGTIPSGSSMLQTIIIKDAIFDDATATLDVGMSGFLDGLAKSTDIDLTKLDGDAVSVYSTTGVDVPVIGTLDPKGSTQGQGRIIVTYVESV